MIWLKPTEIESIQPSPNNDKSFHQRYWYYWSYNRKELIWLTKYCTRRLFLVKYERVVLKKWLVVWEDTMIRYVIYTQRVI